MNKNLHYLIVALLCLPLLSHAQESRKAANAPNPGINAININTETTPSNQSAQLRNTQVEIGTNYFDLQSNNSSGHRIYEDAEGNRYAGWHFGEQPTDFPNRGTAVNRTVFGEWETQDRVEGEIRGGYSSYVVNSTGDQFVSSHVNDGTWHLGFHKKLADDSDWTTGVIPSNTPSGMVWGKIAVGGTNEEIIHVVGITLSSNFGGEAYLGMDQHLLYYRSMDKGESWDLQDVILPGIDSTLYNTISAEAYSIEARENTVAVSVTSPWGDAVVLKSSDNGDTWTNHMVLDCPLDKYDFSMPYTPEDIGNTSMGADSLDVLSTDGDASLLIDNDGKVHLAVGRMYYFSEGDGNYLYYPGVDGLFYWNEDTAEPTIATTLQDFDGDDSISLTTNIASYYRSLTGMPSLGVDADGNLYLAYAALNELYVDDEDDQNFRGIYIMKSTDNGASWTEPFSVINETTLDPIFIPEIESIYPQIPPIINESVPVLFHQDYRPGLHVLGDQDPSEETLVVVIDLNKEDFSTIDTKIIDVRKQLKASITPTLATTNVVLSYAPTENTSLEYNVLDISGKVIQTYSKAVLSGQTVQENITVENLPKGTYFVEVLAEQASNTFKFVKQ